MKAIKCFNGDVILCDNISIANGVVEIINNDDTTITIKSGNDSLEVVVEYISLHRVESISKVKSVNGDRIVDSDCAEDLHNDDRGDAVKYVE